MSVAQHTHSRRFHLLAAALYLALVSLLTALVGASLWIAATGLAVALAVALLGARASGGSKTPRTLPWWEADTPRARACAAVYRGDAVNAEWLGGRR